MNDDFVEIPTPPSPFLLRQPTQSLTEEIKNLQSTWVHLNITLHVLALNTGFYDKHPVGKLTRWEVPKELDLTAPENELHASIQDMREAVCRLLWVMANMKFDGSGK